jgi:hypothetical protein
VELLAAHRFFPPSPKPSWIHHRLLDEVLHDHIPAIPQQNQTLCTVTRTGAGSLTAYLTRFCTTTFLQFHSRIKLFAPSLALALGPINSSPFAVIRNCSSNKHLGLKFITGPLISASSDRNLTLNKSSADGPADYQHGSLQLAPPCATQLLDCIRWR